MAALVLPALWSIAVPLHAQDLETKPAARSEATTPTPAAPTGAGLVVGWITAIQSDQPDAAELGKPVPAPPEIGDPYVLAFEGGTIRPEPGLDPKLFERVRADPDGASHAMVMLTGRVMLAQVTELESHGAVVLGTHPWQCVKVRVPHACVYDISRLPFVRWIGLPTPGQKLDPELAKQVLRGDQKLELHVNLFESDRGEHAVLEALPVPVVPPRPGSHGDALPVMRWNTHGAVLARLEALGFVWESWDEMTLSYRGTLPATSVVAVLALDPVLFVEPVAHPKLEQVQSVAMIQQDRVRGTYDGNGVAVGIIDSGIADNPWHQDYSNKWYWWWDNTGLGATHDLLGHGTHVTGTAIGDGTADYRQMGMAPGVGRDVNARVFLGRLFDDSPPNGNSVGDPGWLYSAFLSAPGGRAPSVVNNSWGASPSGSRWNGTEVQARQIDGFVYTGNQTYVYAAGNGASGVNSPGVDSPGSAKNVITVGSVDVFADSSGRAGSRSNFSDFGVGDGRQKPDLTAPGSVITSCLNNTASSYTQKSGTSMATPHVTGVVASLADNNQFFEYNPPAVKALLLATAGDGTVRPQIGHGLVNSWRANYGWSWIYAGSLSVPFTWSYFDIDVPANIAGMKVVTTWTEPPVSAGGTAARVNNVQTYLDIEPFSNVGNDGFAVTSGSDTVTSFSGSVSGGGFPSQAAGHRVRVKVYANSIFPFTTAKWAVCVSLTFGDGGNAPALTLTPSTTLLRPNDVFTMQANIAALSGESDLESARIALTGFGGCSLLMMQRTTFDNLVHAFAGTGYWSYPFPTVGDMTVGSSSTRDLLFQLRAQPTSGIVNLVAVGTAQNRSRQSSAQTSICVDGLAPQPVTGLTSPTHSLGAWSSNADVRVNWSPAIDNGCAGIAGLAWTFDQTTNAVPASMNQTGDPGAVTFRGLSSSVNPYWMAIRAVDRVGNLSTTTARLGGFYIDTLAPSLLSISINGGATYTSSLLADLSFGASDAPSGVARISYSLDGSAWSSFDPYTGSATNFDLANPALGGNANEGSKTVYARVMDRAGNLSAVRSATIEYLRCPIITSVVSSPFPTVTTNALVINGTDLGGATALMFGTRTITSHRLEDLVDGVFFGSGDNLIYLHPPQGLPPGQYAIRIVNPACTSAPFTVTLVAPTTPQLSTSSFPRAGGQQSFVVHRGNLPSTTVCYLAFSQSNTPSAVPGLISLGIGGGFSSLFVLQTPFATNPSTGIARIGPVTVPTSFANSVLWYQCILVDLAHPSATPIPVTNVVRCQYVP